MNKVINTSWEEQLKELESQAVDIIPRDKFAEKLKWSYENQIPLKIKFGADPSSSDIHIGHAVVLNKLKKFQDFGHEVIFLIGDYTAMIGDPTGKNKTRPTLAKEDVLKNAETYKSQIAKILDLDKTKVVYNSTWLDKLSSSDLIKIVSNATVHHISSREDFSKRIRENTPIHLHEFIYPVIQGYDSVELKSDLEIGGTDQLFNLLMGRNMQGAFNQKEKQIVFTLPLLEGLDGVNKMSKSLNNYVSINDTAEDMFGKIMSISDNLMITYYQLVYNGTVDETENILKSLNENKLHPMEAKKQLAVNIVAQYYGDDAGVKERESFEARFSKKQIPGNISTKEVVKGDVDLIDIAFDLGWVKSKGEFRRLLKQNAVSVDGKKVKEEVIKIDNSLIFKVGKLKIVKLVVV